MISSRHKNWIWCNLLECEKALLYIYIYLDRSCFQLRFWVGFRWTMWCNEKRHGQTKLKRVVGWSLQLLGLSIDGLLAIPGDNVHEAVLTIGPALLIKVHPMGWRLENILEVYSRCRDCVLLIYKFDTSSDADCYCCGDLWHNKTEWPAIMSTSLHLFW